MSQVNVTIMGQPYKLSCKEGEQAVLVQAETYLYEKMCHFRDTVKIKGSDDIDAIARGTK